MRRIKLYEAFRSDILSKLTLYLKKSGVSDREKSNFINDMKSIFEGYKIPIDKIENSDVDYKAFKKLWNVNTPEFDNEFDTYAIKFWFSSEGKYLGKTGIGKVKYNSKVSADSLFPSHCLDYISENIARSGFLIPSPPVEMDDDGNIIEFKDYINYIKSLPNGTKVIAFLGEIWQYDEGELERIVMGKIYQDDRGQVFIIHNDADHEGSFPSGSDWEQYGDYSWVLNRENGGLCNDHLFLSVYQNGDEPIAYKYETEDLVSDDPEIYNCPVDKVGRIIPFKNKEIEKIKNDANFGIMINIDQILKRGGYKPTDIIKSERGESKAGIIGGPLGLSDDELRKINIDRRTNEIINRLGITTEGIDFTKIGSLLSIFIGNWFIFEFFSAGHRYQIDNILDNIIYLILRLEELESNKDNASLKNTINIYVNSIKKTLIDRKEINRKLNIELGDYLDQIKEQNPEIGNILNEMVNFGKMFTDKTKNTQFNNVLSLKMFSNVVNNIKRTAMNSNNEYSSLLESYIKKFILRENGRLDLYGDSTIPYVFNNVRWMTTIDLGKTLDYAKTFKILI